MWLERDNCWRVPMASLSNFISNRKILVITMRRLTLPFHATAHIYRENQQPTFVLSTDIGAKKYDSRAGLPVVGMAAGLTPSEAATFNTPRPEMTRQRAYLSSAR